MMVTSDLTTSTSAVILVVPWLSLARQLFPRIASQLPWYTWYPYAITSMLNIQYSSFL